MPSFLRHAETEFLSKWYYNTKKNNVKADRKEKNNFSRFHKTLFSIFRLPARIYDRFPTDFSPEFFLPSETTTTRATHVRNKNPRLNVNQTSCSDWITRQQYKSRATE